MTVAELRQRIKDKKDDDLIHIVSISGEYKLIPTIYDLTFYPIKKTKRLPYDNHDDFCIVIDIENKFKADEQ